MPLEVIVPAISAIFLAFLAHLVTMYSQARANKHDFSIKAFENVTKEIYALKLELSEERRSNRGLTEENVGLKGLNYRLETEIELLKITKEENKQRIAELSMEVSSLKEHLHQLTLELDMLKREQQKIATKKA